MCASSLNKPSSQEGLNAGERRAQLRALLHGINAKIGICDPNWWDVAAEIVNEEIEALARHPPFNEAIEAAWQPIETAPRDGTWILIAEDHCWPPDLVRWQPERKERVINGNRYHPVPAGWFGSPGGRSRFDVPDGHLMKATRWMPLPKSSSLKLPDYRGGEAKTGAAG